MIIPLKKVVVFFLLIFIGLVSKAQINNKAFQINEFLGRGINYGNMFEAPSETAWGNQWLPEYPKIIANLGFNHVRIPIRWEPSERSLLNPPYTIQPSFLGRIKEVVDSSLSSGLYAIINMHHHDSLYKYPDEQKERFLFQWKQISEYFKNYSDSLLFEILNEPHDNLTPAKWNVFMQEALAKIRENNPDRVVLIGTPEYGGLGGLSEIQIPDDENLILTVHYYNPFQFTHQGASWVGEHANEWLGTKWNDTETEREIMRQEFASLQDISESENIPVHIGEFGAYSLADLSSRSKWTTFLARYFEELSWSWAYWEFSAGFGIYNPDTKVVNQELVNALIHNELPEAARYIGTEIYSSNFEMDADGWVLYTQQGASAELSRSEKSLTVSILNSGSETWHVQLVRNNFNLEAGKKYRVTFAAKSNSTRSIDVNMGMSVSPWSAYSDYYGFTLYDSLVTYSFVFDMNTNDNAARIAFDLGKSTEDVTISEIILEEVYLDTQTLKTNPENFSTRIFPNPFIDVLQIQNTNDFRQVSILNLQGKLMMTQTLFKGMNYINTELLKKGIYIIVIVGVSKKFTSKVVRL